MKYLLIGVITLMTVANAVKQPEYVFKCNITNPEHLSKVEKCAPQLLPKALPNGPLIIRRQDACDMYDKSFECLVDSECMDKSKIPDAMDNLKKRGLDCTTTGEDHIDEVVMSAFTGPQCKIHSFKKQMQGYRQCELGALKDEDGNLLWDPIAISQRMCKISQTKINCLKQQNCVEVDQAFEKLLNQNFEDLGYDCDLERNHVEHKKAGVPMSSIPFERIVTCDIHNTNVQFAIQDCFPQFLPETRMPDQLKLTKNDLCESFDDSFECFVKLGCMEQAKIGRAHNWLAERGLNCTKPESRTDAVIMTTFPEGSRCKALHDNKEYETYLSCRDMTLGSNFKRGKYISDRKSRSDRPFCQRTKGRMDCMRAQHCIDIHPSFENIAFDIFADMGFRCGCKSLVSSIILVVPVSLFTLLYR